MRTVYTTNRPAAASLAVSLLTVHGISAIVGNESVVTQGFGFLVGEPSLLVSVPPNQVDRALTILSQYQADGATFSLDEHQLREAVKRSEQARKRASLAVAYVFLTLPTSPLLAACLRNSEMKAMLIYIVYFHIAAVIGTLFYSLKTIMRNYAE